jgi:hypothetical protein
MGTAARPAKRSPGSWDAFADVDVFVDEVLAELEAVAKDGVRPLRSAPSQYIGSLPEPKCAQLKEHLRRAYESNQPDGPRSFIMVAWACKGIVP